MASQHTVLITAPGGNIGTELVPQLLSDNMKLVLPTSNASRLQSKIESNSNITVEEGNIKDPLWIQSLLQTHNVDVVFLCLTGSDELFTTCNFFDAMQRAGTVKQLVYLSACGDFVSTEGIKLLMRLPPAAHVLVKNTIELKIAYGDLPWKTTVIGPALFFSNDLRSKQTMLQEGLFNEPTGAQGCSRVSTSDIALAIHNVILDPSKWAGKKINVGSKQLYTARELTKLWSDAIGKEVRPCEDLDAFEQAFTKVAGVEWGRDLRLMYEMFTHVPFGMTEEEYKTQVECLGKEPEDYEAWVKKVGESWR